MYSSYKSIGLSIYPYNYQSMHSSISYHLLASHVLPNWILRDWHENPMGKGRLADWEPPQGVSCMQRTYLWHSPRTGLHSKRLTPLLHKLKMLYYLQHGAGQLKIRHLLFEQHNWIAPILNSLLYWFELIICAFVLSWLPQSRSAPQCNTAQPPHLQSPPLVWKCWHFQALSVSSMESDFADKGGTCL